MSVPIEALETYTSPDRELSAGSTLGSAKLCLVLKATGSIDRVYSVDWAENAFCADYVESSVARRSLLGFVEQQKPSRMNVEFSSALAWAIRKILAMPAGAGSPLARVRARPEQEPRTISTGRGL